MRNRPLTSVMSRVIVGTIALYSLILQAFLASATPVSAFFPDHVICAAADPGGTAGSEKPVKHDHQCCTAVSPVAVVPPVQAMSLLAWPLTDAVEIVWRPEASLYKTGPPTGAHRPRGPPLV